MISEKQEHELLKTSVRNNGLAWSIDNLREEYQRKYLIKNLEKAITDIETLLKVERSLQ